MRALIALLLLAPLPAAAQAGSCRIELTGLDFGPYRSLDRAPVTTIARLNIRCTPRPGGAGVPSVILTTGSSNQYSERYMTSGMYVLRYNLYADPAHRLVLGDGSTGTISFPAPRTRAIGRASWAIFGAIAPGQRVPAGIYTDALLIQVEF